MVGRVVEVVVAHLDDYFAWAKYLASHCAPVQDSQQGARLSDPTMQCRALLCMLEEPDRRLPEALLNSNLLIEYSIAAWIAVNPLTCDAYLSFDGNHICPIMSLFAKLILSKNTQQKVIDVLYAPGSKSRKLRMEVIRATISRCATIAQLEREAADKMVARVPLAKVAGRLMTGVEAVVCCMETILQVVRGLSIVSDMSEGFLRSTFYGELAQAFHTWLVKDARQTDSKVIKESRRQAFALLDVAETLVDKQGEQHGDRHWKLAGQAWLQMLQSGSISIFVEAMHSIPASDKFGTVVDNSMALKQAQCDGYPFLANAVATEIARLLGKSFWDTGMFAHTGWTGLWRWAALDFLAASLTPAESRAFYLCDNIYVRAHPVLLDPSDLCLVQMRHAI
jgi:hypothetical protein